MVASLPVLVLQLPAGVLVDRFDRRRAMMTSQFLRFLAAAALCIALMTHLAAAPLLLVFAFVEGIFAVLYSMAEIAIIPQVVSSTMLSEAMASNEARSHVALLAGRPLGGLLYGIGRALPIAVDAISNLVSLITLWLMKTTKAEGEPARNSADLPIVHQIREGVAWIWQDSVLRLALVVCTSTNILFQSISLLLVVLAKSRGYSSASIGVLLAGPGAGGVCGALVAPTVLRRSSRHGARAFIGWCVMGWFAAVTAIALSVHRVVWFIAWAAVAFIGAHLNVAMAAYQAQHVPRRLLVRVESANRFIARGAILPLGALLGGYGIALYGPRATAVVVAALLGLIALLALRTTFTPHSAMPPSPTAKPTPSPSAPTEPRLSPGAVSESALSARAVGETALSTAVTGEAVTAGASVSVRVADGGPPPPDAAVGAGSEP